MPKHIKQKTLANIITKYLGATQGSAEHQALRESLLELCDKEPHQMHAVLSKQDTLPQNVATFKGMLVVYQKHTDEATEKHTEEVPSTLPQVASVTPPSEPSPTQVTGKVQVILQQVESVTPHPAEPPATTTFWGAVVKTITFNWWGEDIPSKNPNCATAPTGEDIPSKNPDCATAPTDEKDDVWNDGLSCNTQRILREAEDAVVTGAVHHDQ